MIKIKEKLTKEKGIEFSQIYEKNKYRDNGFLMWLIRVVVIFMGTYGSLYAFISGFKYSCDMEFITWICVICALLFGTLYGLNKGGLRTFIISMSLLLLIVFLLNQSFYCFIVDVWNACVEFLNEQNISALKMSQPDVPVSARGYNETVMWSILCFIIATIIGFFSFCKVHFIPVFLVTFAPLEAVLCFGLVPNMVAVVCFFCCNGVVLALSLNKFKKKHFNADVHLKGTAVMSLIICLFFVGALMLSNFCIGISNYQRPEKYDEIRESMLMFDAERSDARADEIEDLKDVSDRSYDYDDHLYVSLPYKEDSVYLKGNTGSYYFNDKWYDLESPDYAQYPVSNMAEQNISISDIFSTREKGKMALGKMKIDISPELSGHTFLPYGYFNNGNLTADYDKWSYSTMPKTRYEVQYDVRANDLWAEFYADRDYVRRSKSDVYGEYASSYNNFVKQYYTQFPEELTQLKEVAESLKTSDTSRNGLVESITAVKDYLKENAVYDLRPGETPKDKNFTEYFLFENQKGYCIHFATTATLMLRAMGVPARYATGYIITDDDFRNTSDMGKEIIQVDAVDGSETFEQFTVDVTVKDTNAHAWVEVYVENLGWIPIEVTPGYTQSMTALGDLGVEDVTEPTTEMNTVAATTKPTNPPPPKEEPKDSSEGALAGGILLTVLIVLIVVAIGDLITRAIVKKLRMKSFKSKDNAKNVERLYLYLQKLLSCSGFKEVEKESLTNGFRKLFNRFDFVDEEQLNETVVILQKLFYGQKAISDEEVVVVEKFVLSFAKKFIETQKPFTVFVCKFVFFLV